MKLIAGMLGGSGSSGPVWRDAWALDTVYASQDQVGNQGDLFQATVAHTAAADTEPGVGENWATVWARLVNMLAPGDTTGAIAVWVQGTGWVTTTAADLLANSLQAQDGLDSGSVTTGAVTASEDGNTAQLTPTGITMNDAEAGYNHIKALENSTVTGANPVAGRSEVPPVQALTPGGRLYVPPAYIQTTGDQAVQLNATTKKITVMLDPSVSCAPPAQSIYVKAVGTAGNLTATLCEVGTAIEPEGQLNSNRTKSNADMTSNTAPSPLVAWMVDSAGANAEGMNTASSAFNSNYTQGVRSNAAPTGGAPIHLGFDYGAGNTHVVNRVRILCTDATAVPKAFTFWGSNVASPTKHTNDDWTQIVAGLGGKTWTAENVVSTLANECDLFNFIAYRHYRITFTDRTGAAAYVQIEDVQFIDADFQEAPSTSIATLATLAVSTIGWKQMTFDTPQQLRRGKRYAIVFSVDAGTDISLSVRRENTALGCAIPYRCVCKSTTDGGTSWTQQMQDGDLRPAMLNFVLWSTANHTPKLVYGRYSGDGVALFNGVSWSATTIPEAGIALDCEALTAGTNYWVNAYVSGGNLVLEATVTDIVIQDGIEVKSGATSHRNVGYMQPKALQGATVGPIRVRDAMHVWNRHNQLPTEIGRICPFVTTTNYSSSSVYHSPGIAAPGGIIGWNPVHATDFLVSFVCGDTTLLQFQWCNMYSDYTNNVLAISLDSAIPRYNHQGGHSGTSYLDLRPMLNKAVTAGAHTLNLFFQSDASTFTLYTYYRGVNLQYFARATGIGTILA